MKLFIVFVFVSLLLSFSAYAGGKQVECENCDYLRHGAETGIKPAIPGEICTIAPFATSGEVQLTFYWRNGKIRRIIKRRFDRRKTVFVRICTGQQWFDDLTGKVELCLNLTIASSVMAPGSRLLVRKRREWDACLLGPEKCAAYKAKHLYPFNY